MKRIFFLIVLSAINLNAMARLKMPAMFTDGMVLQQNANAPIWGWALPGQKVQVSGSWSNKKVVTITDKTGKWMLKLPTPNAGGPFNIEIRTNIVTRLKNVLIGEVWICSGQSNMQMPLEGWANDPIKNSSEEIADANYPHIRLFTVQKEFAFSPREDVNGSWTACTPASVRSFSATAYFFAKELYERLKVPIGLIHTSWGGTIAEAWTSEPALRTMGDFDKALNTVDSISANFEAIKLADSISNLTASKPKQLLNTWPNRPSVFYNAMIAPVIPYAIRGVIWYQGESNVGRAVQYTTLFPLMIGDWRKRWKQGIFPFYFVQIAPFNYGGDHRQGATMRDAQRRTLALVPNVGMVVTLDIGNLSNIHPANKQDVGKRLALWALNKTYKHKDVVYSGPLYKSIDRKGNKIIVSFTNATDGLHAHNKPLIGFELKDLNGLWKPATATINGDKVYVVNDSVQNPVAVRYAFYDSTVASLFNNHGLPASSFTSEDLN